MKVLSISSYRIQILVSYKPENPEPKMLNIQSEATGYFPVNEDNTDPPNELNVT